MTNPIVRNLHDTLTELLQSGSRSNPALNRLLDDYSKYHAVLVAIGGVFVLILSVLTAIFWGQFRKSPKASNRGWSFEKRTHLCFTMLSGVVALLLGVIVAANLGNAVQPRDGFAGVVDALDTPRPGTTTHRLHQAFDAWLRSETTSMPSLVDSRIDERLAWQQPKAIIASVLLAGFVVLGARVWATLIKKSRVRASSWNVTDRAQLLAGAATVGVSLLLMVMVIGNAQASVAPIVLTLQFG